ELYFRMGRVEAQRGGESDQAESYFCKAVDCDPTHVEALQELEKLARSRSDWHRVVDLLALREHAEADAARKCELLTEIGRLLGSVLAAPERAVSYLERAAALAPNEPRAIEPLADVYFKAGKLTDAKQLYARLLSGLKGRKSKDAARWQFRLGAIAER